MIQKPRAFEIAKDLELSSKDIIILLEGFGVHLKNHMARLEDNELDIIFEHYTQAHIVADFSAFFNVVPNEPATHEVSVPETAPEKKEKKNIKIARVVDTRPQNVDLTHLDTEKIEKLVDDKVLESGKKKEKIKKGHQQKGKQTKRDVSEVAKVEHAQKPVVREPKLLVLPDEISVGELASKIGASGVDIVKKLVQLGTFAAVSDVIDFDTAALIAEEFNALAEREIIVTDEDILLAEESDNDSDMTHRPPVVVVMGHVDHGKTSLLDAIRDTHVTDSEAGGITQHIGASVVNINGKNITFLDTPGHEAFTSMRARGAQVTDVAILVVAADDGIMPQTVEAINHAKAAGITIIVAINKIDKEGANPERIKQELTEHELLIEEWGGDTICVNVSALQKTGIENLLEMVLLVAEVKDLKANPNKHARGTIIESRLDRGKGAVATVLIQSGTLKVGDVIIAGTAVGRVRAMHNHLGERVESATPSMPVEITGLAETPSGGDLFYAVTDEKRARDVAEARKQKIKDEINKSRRKVSLDNLFDSIKEGEMKELNIIVKADVAGSVEAVKQSLEKLSNDEVKVRTLHGGVGGVTETDVMLASASNAIIVGFNVRPDPSALVSAEQSGVDLRLYRVIYEAIEEIELAMRGMLEPKYKEVIIGHASVRATFKVSGVGTIAGCYVTDGKISRNCEVRVNRDNIVVYEGKLDSLKRFKDDAREVASGYECGIGLERYNDIKEGDVIECFVMEEVER